MADSQRAHAEYHSPEHHSEEKQKTHEKSDLHVEGLQGHDILESVGLDENADVMGEVSETSSQSKEKKGGGMAGKAGKAVQDMSTVRDNLLKNLPPVEIMKKQIGKEVEKEIRHLHNKALKLIRKSNNPDYFELSNILKKIRELKGILYSLMRLSFDGLKVLWLRFVHGIM